MNQRRRIVLLAAVAVLLGVIAWSVLWSREPQYGGKQLSEWILELISFGPTSDKGIKAVAAIQQIDTNAIPFLLAELQAKRGPWERLPASLERWWPQSVKLPMAQERWERAIAGFDALGEIAEPAIPPLDTIVQTRTDDTARSAQHALAGIGTERAASVLIRCLTNSDSEIRHNAVVCLSQIGEKAHPAIPALLTNLSTGDVATRRYVARALPRVGTPATVAVPELAKLLSDPDRSVQSAAIQSLATYDSEAVSATPALEQFILQAQSPGLRRLACEVLIRINSDIEDGCIRRGPKNGKMIALVFTGHEYAEGAGTILGELSKSHAKASWFLTGDFVRNTNFSSLVVQAAKDGHYIGPHSDKHLLYCAWDNDKRTLVTKVQFRNDLLDNQIAIIRLLSPPQTSSGSSEEADFKRRYITWSPGTATISQFPYFLPPYEHFNGQIVDWTKSHELTLINFTPGTRSNADYTGEADTNFVSSQAIFDSILKREREDPHGLNGFILLFHLGSGPGRKDKFHTRFGELLDVLAAKGYQFVRVDELLEPPAEKDTK